MKHLLWVGMVLAGCSVSPDSPESSAMFSGSMAVHSSRATQGEVFHGAAFHRWTITLSTMEGCSGDDQASIEIDTLSGMNDIPIATVALRTDLNTIAVLPSAFLTSAGVVVSGGSITIDSGGTFVTGSFTAQTASGDVTGTFGAPVCP